MDALEALPFVWADGRPALSQPWNQVPANTQSKQELTHFGKNPSSIGPRASKPDEYEGWSRAGTEPHMCPRTQAMEQAECAVSSDNGHVFTNGQLVEVIDLARRVDLNHQIARVQAYLPSKARYEVCFEASHLQGFKANVRTENLVLFGTETCLSKAASFHSSTNGVDGIGWHGVDGIQEPLLPEMLAFQWVKETLRRATLTPQVGNAHAGLRIISMRGAVERRQFMATCLEDLAKIGVNCCFTDAVDGRQLGLTEENLRGQIHHLSVNNTNYVIDTSAWPATGWTAELMAHVERGFHRMKFFPHYWHAIQQNIQDPHTLGFVGGHMSHASAWQEAYQQDWDWVFILEDDALPAPTLEVTWRDIWRIVSYEVNSLQSRGEDWDILYVGRTLSMTPEGPRVSGILCEPGYCLRTHSYCLSRRGYKKLLQSGIATTMIHCPQDEVLATLWTQDHVHDATWHKISSLQPDGIWRALAVRWRGLTAQLIDVERSDRATSQAAVHT